MSIIFDMSTGVLLTNDLSAKVIVVFFGYVHVDVTNVYCRRNLRLRSVNRPVPSSLTRYWSCPLHSTMTPDLSHLLGCGPNWFGTKTLSQIVNLGR